MAYSFAARSFLLTGPKRLRRSDDRARRQRAEVSPVERVRRPPVHEKDLTVGDDVTALPDGQRATASVMLARRTPLDRVDRDRELISANGLPRKRQHALQQWNAARQIAAICEECCQRFRRLDRDKLGDGKSASGVQPVKTDWHASGSVPYITWHGFRCDRGHHEHGSPHRR